MEFALQYSQSTYSQQRQVILKKTVKNICVERLLLTLCASLNEKDS